MQKRIIVEGDQVASFNLAHLVCYKSDFNANISLKMFENSKVYHNVLSLSSPQGK